jgi:hypothetical protein
LIMGNTYVELMGNPGVSPIGNFTTVLIDIALVTSCYPRYDSIDSTIVHLSNGQIYTMKIKYDKFKKMLCGLGHALIFDEHNTYS